MVTGSAEILIFFRIFPENRLLYKRFYKNICCPFLLSTIPYFSGTFKDFHIIYAPHRDIKHFSLSSSSPNYCSEYKKAAIPQNRCILSATIPFIMQQRITHLSSDQYLGLIALALRTLPLHTLSLLLFHIAYISLSFHFI